MIPQSALTYYTTGVTALNDGRNSDAVHALSAAIAAAPGWALPWINYAIAAKRQGLADVSIAALRRAVDLDPRSSLALYNLGVEYMERRELPMALAHYRAASAIDPVLYAARYNAAITALALGDWEYGWANLGARKSIGQLEYPPGKAPDWDGTPLSCRTILLRHEGGYGDTLQFIRLAGVIRRDHPDCRIVLHCPEGLTRILATSGLIDLISLDTWPLPDTDVQAWLQDLPALLDLGGGIPTDPYLTAEGTLAAQWEERLRPLTGLRVGLVWAGATRRESPIFYETLKRRSTDLATLAPLGLVPGIHWISLQVGERAGERHPDMALIDYTAELKDWAATAALISNLDLVISVDTAVAHLAGALGKPVWLLNRFDSCWRWLAGRTDSPWYPTMHIFTQPKPGDWDNVVDRIAISLRALK